MKGNAKLFLHETAVIFLFVSLYLNKISYIPFPAIILRMLFLYGNLKLSYLE